MIFICYLIEYNKSSKITNANATGKTKGMILICSSRLPLSRNDKNICAETVWFFMNCMAEIKILFFLSGLDQYLFKKEELKDLIFNGLEKCIRLIICINTYA